MTAVTAPSKPGRVAASLPQTIRDIIVITKRNLLRNLRLPQLIILSTIQPIMFLFLFTYVFGGAIGGTLPDAAAGEYINWLIPGLLVQTAAFGAGQTALGLTEDLSKGVIDRFRSLPMARSAVLAGRTVSDVIRNGFVIGLMMAVGILIGFRYQTSLAGLFAGMALAMVFSFAFSWIMATIGLLVKNPEAVQAAIFLPVFPLVFASSVFVPTQTMPSWLRAFADNQPVTVTVDALRGLILGEGALLPGNTVIGQVALSLFYSGMILAIFVPLSVRLYRRTVS
ncbi:MAG: ABC transporter permease [Acidimicrobiia bacterium]|jgi:ABC transporter DrrB family efflux protein|nr:ABC transporter permease [Acidimicrobiia bacterium]